MEFGHSGDAVFKAVQASVVNALMVGFPVIYDEITVPLVFQTTGTVREEEIGKTSMVFNDPEALAIHLSEKLEELETKLQAAESVSQID